jgi:hypothetical protein
MVVKPLSVVSVRGTSRMKLARLFLSAACFASGSDPFLTRMEALFESSPVAGKYSSSSSNALYPKWVLTPVTNSEIQHTLRT